jgi:hypothetical protein
MKNMDKKMEKRHDVCEVKIYSRDLHDYDLMKGCYLRFGCNLFYPFLLTSLLNQREVRGS